MLNDEQVKKAVNYVRITGEVVCKGNVLIRELREATSDGVVKMALQFIHGFHQVNYDEHEKAIGKLVDLVGIKR